MNEVKRNQMRATESGTVAGHETVMSMRRMLGESAEQARFRKREYESAMRAALAFAPLQLPPEAKYLGREEAHERADFR